VLQRWVPDNDGLGGLEDLSGGGGGRGWSAEDMFRANAAHGVQSTWDETECAPLPPPLPCLRCIIHRRAPPPQRNTHTPNRLSLPPPSRITAPHTPAFSRRPAPRPVQVHNGAGYVWP